jgi:hypothetical protein
MIRIEESAHRQLVIYYRLLAVASKAITYQKVVYRVCHQCGVNEIEYAIK